ncbi:hypothetical protein DERF_011681 [Dermatophagoides farinae]|uniref:Sodium/nucleoside cotransporter n=1 Tax=Dermatophagoides farinae TaxID=6954 RepID=A0A922HSN6_DERFA|nr:hypothetical protein DERF_011681 [Dermatophagoides farinae]
MDKSTTTTTTITESESSSSFLPEQSSSSSSISNHVIPIDIQQQQQQQLQQQQHQSSKQQQQQQQFSNYHHNHHQNQQQINVIENEKLTTTTTTTKRPLYEREISELSIQFSQFLFGNRFARHLLYAFIFVLYNLFLAYAIHKSWDKTENYCDGVKLLVIITALIYMSLIKRFIIVPYFWPIISRSFNHLNDHCISDLFRRLLRCLCWTIVLLSIGTIIGIRCYRQPERIYSVAGYFGFILIGFIGSKHRHHINWNQILWGFTVQLLFGIFVLQTIIGRSIFQCIGDKINTFLSFTKSGTEMVFGYLSNGQLLGTIAGNYTLIIGSSSNIEMMMNDQIQVQLPSLPLMVQSSIFALSGMPVIIFFSFFVSILYYYGIMQIIVNKFGHLLQTTIGTTACESISASGNIFLGMCESPLLIKPFLSSMTKSELHAVMTGGFATIAGSVMAAYISFGISATHLLSASVMAAPAALALSKLFYPETEQSKTTVDDICLEKGSERSAIEAGSNGAISAVSLVASILANLIAFVSFLTFLDAVINYFGMMIDLPELSFKMILSKLFIPIAMMLGVEWSDAERIAGLIGIKMFINEFVAYQQLSEYIAIGSITNRSQTIATFALCGFANLSSIGIQVGSLSTLAPARASDLAELAFRAMVTGSIACFMTACVAGMLI